MINYFLLIIGLNFFSVDKTELKSDFDIIDYEWLVGNWKGSGFGGELEEFWNTPSMDGTMMGTFRHHTNEGKLTFYEFMILDKDGIRLKHFNPDLNGWETKEEFVTFKMISYSKDKIEMEGLTYEKISDTQVKISLLMKSKEGTRTEVFNMSRF